ncbi:DUF3716 domain-containing protein [Candidatus Bathyarchaeota archaeon]|nr:DUF3716 domain-containing protein [Candidatus Bathyarchaeota archaeon]
MDYINVFPQAGHRLVNLNDNGDGTLSVVGKYKSTTGQITGRVVSRKPLDPSEPPMPIPKPPENQRPLTTTPGRPSPPAAPQRPTTATSGRSTRVIPPRADLLSTGPSTQSSSALSPAFDLGTKPMAYLQSVLPKTFNFFGAFHVTKEGPLLLQLPIKRRATAEWIERITSLKVSAPRCLIALLLFLTGTAAEDPCPTCTTSDTGEECIISGPSFPPFAVDRFAGSCAACLYRCNRWHQKNQCLLHVGGAPTPRARSQSFVDAPMGPAEDESESGDEDEDEMMSVDDQPLANGTSASRTPRDPFPLPTRRGQGAATSGALLNQGNLIPADVLEMEDWEVAPGTIRNTSDEPESKPSPPP